MNNFIIFFIIYIIVCFLFGFPENEKKKIYTLYFFISVFIYWIYLFLTRKPKTKKK